MAAGSSYKEAGVDIDKADAFIKSIRPLVKSTYRTGVLGEIGAFGGMFQLGAERYRDPVLVSATDGVGTKIKIAVLMGRHDTIGIDLVAMCANDIVVTGAEPLFFLDYYATGHLKVDTAATVIQGIARGCELAGCALVGGETAEMPGFYSDDDYDLAGFCVGVVEKEKLIDGSRVAPGDALLGLASRGPHSNGYSLIRKILELSEAALADPFGDSTLGDTLLTPTRLYVKPLLRLLETVDVRALAHITGGGLPENLPRVLPKGTRAVLDADSWQRPAIFTWLQDQGRVADAEMLRTFNCGVGMVACVAQADLDTALAVLRDAGETAWPLGSIATGTADAAPWVEIRG